MKYSFITFADAKEISKKQRARISKYTRKTVLSFLGSYNSSDYQYWKALTETARTLHHHPNSIVRHESAFFLGEFKYRDELEKCTAVQHLRYAIRRDKSIVVKHEAVEAMGEFPSISSVGAAADMAKMLAYQDYLKDAIAAAEKEPHNVKVLMSMLHNEDVIATAEESFDNIIEWMKKQGYKDTVEELLKWRDYRKWKDLTRQNLRTKSKGYK